MFAFSFYFAIAFNFLNAMSRIAIAVAVATFIVSNAGAVTTIYSASVAGAGCA